MRSLLQRCHLRASTVDRAAVNDGAVVSNCQSAFHCMDRPEFNERGRGAPSPHKREHFVTAVLTGVVLATRAGLAIAGTGHFPGRPLGWGRFWASGGPFLLPEVGNIGPL